MRQSARYHAHELVYETALEMARVTVESYAKINNEWYGENKDKLETHALRLAPKLLEQARATLAAMLTLPTPDHLKDQISDALILDNTLRHKRSKYGVTRH